MGPIDSENPPTRSDSARWREMQMQLNRDKCDVSIVGHADEIRERYCS
jgi:hypothetical protein